MFLTKSNSGKIEAGHGLTPYRRGTQERHETSNRRRSPYKVELARRVMKELLHCSYNLEPRAFRTSLRYSKLPCNTLALPTVLVHHCTVQTKIVQSVYMFTSSTFFRRRSCKQLTSWSAPALLHSSAVASPSRTISQPVRQGTIEKCSSLAGIFLLSYGRTFEQIQWRSFDLFMHLSTGALGG